MKATPEDAQPRRDGWCEHEATWAEVTKGTVIASPAKRSERWEIVDVAMNTQVQPGMTLWMRAREMTTGQEFTVTPRAKHVKVTILTLNPADTMPLEPSPPSDADVIMLLVEKLGAEVMATRDHETGEIICPDYTYRSHIPEDGIRVRVGLVEHLRLAHGMKVDDSLPYDEAVTIHGRSHNPSHRDIGKGGFPHRHVPEYLDALDRPRRTRKNQNTHQP